VMASGEVGVLILAFTQLCSLVLSVMIPLYRTTVSQTLRRPLRGEISETEVLCPHELPTRTLWWS
jgi:hypothetical protein